MIGYWIGLSGMYVFLDGLASLYTYTGAKKDGQSWIRDHSWRIIRCLVGIALMILGSQT